MSYQVHACRLRSRHEIAPGVIEIWVENKVLAAEAAPGQFLHIRCGDSMAMPLRRPISICDVQGDLLRFVYEVKGRGTQALCEQSGVLDILGPLGNGFTVENKKYHHPAVIGGGIGAYPMLFLAKRLVNAKVFLGFRNKALVTLLEDFQQAAERVMVSTDDGSYGMAGFALEQLEAAHDGKPFDIIYACGPKGMLRAVKAFAEKAGVPCQLSLEERMGCGIGACLTCSCETKHEGTEKYQRVCRNGPVFWAEEVVL